MDCLRFLRQLDRLAELAGQIYSAIQKMLSASLRRRIWARPNTIGLPSPAPTHSSLCGNLTSRPQTAKAAVAWFQTDNGNAPVRLAGQAQFCAFQSIRLTTGRRVMSEPTMSKPTPRRSNSSEDRLGGIFDLNPAPSIPLEALNPQTRILSAQSRQSSCRWSCAIHRAIRRHEQQPKA